MTTTAAAIYENGVLRPLAPLPLEEGARVEVTVFRPSTGGRTGAELAEIWPSLPHLSPEEATDFESDLAQCRAAEGTQAAPEWE
jgi:predicted DNA-binding antitoxin AbrB/MazE fold protein